MKILQITDENDAKVLRSTSQKVTKIDVALVNLANAMANMVKANSNFKGLAAPQVGHLVRMFVIKFHKNVKVFINPEIVYGSGKVDSTESCLSCGDARVTVKRYSKVLVNYNTTDGKAWQEKIKGDDAIAFQHELSHLNGETLI